MIYVEIQKIILLLHLLMVMFMDVKFSDYFFNSQKAHSLHALNAAKNNDHLKMRYHEEVIYQQKKHKRVLSRVEKQIIYLDIHKIKIMREVEKYDPSKSWLK